MRATTGVILLIACALGCSQDSETYTDRQQPVLLMDRFPSYASEQQVVRAMPGAKLDTTVRAPLDKSGRRQPQLNLVELTARNYSHLNCSGELLLEFSNDRLCCVWFFPQDYGEYLSRLKEHGVVVEDVSLPTSERNPQILTHRDEHNRYFVSWQDVRLLRQDERWHQRYSPYR